MAQIDIKPVNYDPDGAPLSVEIKSGFAQPGRYTIIFWESDKNTFFRDDARGNFMNTDDDRYWLTDPLADYDGRILDCLIFLRLVPPLKQYRTEFIVRQGDEIITSDVIEGESEEVLQVNEHFLELKAVSA